MHQGGSMIIGEVLDRVMEILAPSINVLLKESPKKVFSWVVLDSSSTGGGTCRMAEGTYGGVHIGKHDYRALAQNKAVQSQRTGLPNRFISAISLRPGDTPHYGSWFEEGLSVGVSGLEPSLDEMISRLLVVTILELAKIEFEKWKRDNPEEDFLP